MSNAAIGPGRCTLQMLLMACLLAAIAFGESPAAEKPAPAGPDPEKVQAAVDRAVGWLKANLPQTRDGRSTLVALALLKAEVPVDAPEIDNALQKIVAKVEKGKYKPTSVSEHGYESGLDAILLEAADRTKYKPEIEAIARYIFAAQFPQGSWNYPNSVDSGDTSISQYGVLGLWAASRAGVAVPTQTWDKAALWHVGTQLKNGGFVYHPTPSGGQPTLGMSAAGTASLHVCRMHLFPRAGQVAPAPSEKKMIRKPDRRFGILERVDPTTQRPVNDQPALAPEPNRKPTITQEKIDEAIANGLAYVEANYKIADVPSYKFYYLYTLERLTALADLPQIGEHDWYAEGTEHLLSIQNAAGNWTGNLGEAVDTSFAILFLVRATNKMLNRTSTPKGIGGGLLAGGRGLPDDLKGVHVKDSKVGSRKVQGGVDELLAALENAKSSPVADVQKALVEQVQTGDREALIAQTERLKKLAVDPRSEVRRTAFWALGRSRDVRIVPLLLAGLEDRNVDVVVEAHNALCFLARKPNGLGVPLDPLEGVDEDATDPQRTDALQKWQARAVKLWKAWYLSVRPFDERHDLDEPRPKMN